MRCRELGGLAEEQALPYREFFVVGPGQVVHHACLWRRPNEASPAAPTARPAALADYWAAGHFLAIAMRFASGFVSGLMPTRTSRIPSP